MKDRLNEPHFGWTTHIFIGAAGVGVVRSNLAARRARRALQVGVLATLDALLRICQRGSRGFGPAACLCGPGQASGLGGALGDTGLVGHVAGCALRAAVNEVGAADSLKKGGEEG